jgi:adenylyltransferase/sulfurtransferase
MTKPKYRDLFAAQLPLLGERGQRRLRRAHVLVVGAGGVGSSTVLALAAAGIGRLTAVDPQDLERENFNRCPTAALTDLGMPKVEFLGSQLARREYLRFRGVAARVESVCAETLSDVNVMVSASNTIASRVHAAKLALRLGKPHVGIGIFDARQALGGMVTVWLPRRRDLACQACCLTSERQQGSDSLLGPTAACVGAWAAQLVVRVLTERPSAVLGAGNVVTIDVGRPHVEAWSVRRRPDCSACGTRS